MLFRILLIAFLFCSGAALGDADNAPAPQLSAQAAINIAGRQRMLSQRIAKTYYQIGLGLTPATSKQQLLDAMTQFEQQLDSLSGFKSDSHIAATLAQINRIWAKLMLIAMAEPLRDNALNMHYVTEDLLYVSHRLVQQLQDRSNDSVGRLINIAGRQRMLSQRMAKLYLLRAWGIDTLSIRDELELAQRDFGSALAILRYAPENNDAIDKELDNVVLQWSWFQNVLNQDQLSNYSLIMVDASNEILAAMERVTMLYEQLP